jgi:CBS domain-containing protein
MEYSGIRVGDIMTRNFIYVSPKTNIKECAKTLVKKKVGSLIIKEKDKLLGFLTEREIIWALVKKSKEELKDILAQDIMKRKVVTIPPSADLFEAIKRLKHKKIRRMPVVEHGRVIGLITLKDILKVEPGLFQMLIENIKIKEETAKLRRKNKANKGCGICEICGEYELLQEESGQNICESCYEKRSF